MRFESIVEEEGWALLSRRPLRDFLEEEGGGVGWSSSVVRDVEAGFDGVSIM